MQVERVATDISDDEFSACMNRTLDELEEDLKYYTVLLIILWENMPKSCNKKECQGIRTVE